MRFSRQVVRTYIEERMQSLSDEAKKLGLPRGFDFGNGWAQVRGRGEELNRLYGQWDELRTLLHHSELF